MRRWLAARAPQPTPGPELASHAELTTLDPELSRSATRLLELAHPVEGAAVAVDTRTGEVLVWAELRRSGPKASRYHRRQGARRERVQAVTTAALFEAGRVRPQDRVCISGGLEEHRTPALGRPRGPRACAPFSLALGYSRNAVYAQLATQRLARQELIDVAERLGFNSRFRSTGRCRWADSSVPYNDLEFARTAAGFEGSTLSPLGGAYLASIIAQGGLSRPVHLARRVPDATAEQPDPGHARSPRDHRTAPHAHDGSHRPQRHGPFCLYRRAGSQLASRHPRRRQNRYAPT